MVNDIHMRRSEPCPPPKTHHTVSPDHAPHHVTSHHRKTPWFGKYKSLCTHDTPNSILPPLKPRNHPQPIRCCCKKSARGEEKYPSRSPKSPQITKPIDRLWFQDPRRDLMPASHLAHAVLFCSFPFLRSSRPPTNWPPLPHARVGSRHPDRHHV